MPEECAVVLRARCIDEDRRKRGLLWITTAVHIVVPLLVIDESQDSSVRSIDNPAHHCSIRSQVVTRPGGVAPDDVACAEVLPERFVGWSNGWNILPVLALG